MLLRSIIRRAGIQLRSACHGQKLSSDEHSDVLGQLKMQDISHEEVIDRFHLLYQLDNGSWTVYETFY